MAKTVIAEHRWCQRCRVRPATEVHHKTAVVYGGTDDEQNLVALCSECHREIEHYSFADFEEFMKTPPYAFVIVTVRKGLPLDVSAQLMAEIRNATSEKELEDM